jgi:hypothetical protein
VHDELVGREGEAEDGVGVVEEPQLAAGDAIEPEEPRVAPLEALRLPALRRAIPHDLDDRVALAEPVEEFDVQVARLRPLQQLAHFIGEFDVARIIARGLDQPIEACDRVFPLPRTDL